jgi:hypothetical protein
LKIIIVELPMETIGSIDNFTVFLDRKLYDPFFSLAKIKAALKLAY